MKIIAYLVPFTLAVLVMIYPLRGGDTLGLGQIPSVVVLGILGIAFTIRPRVVTALSGSDVAVLIYLLLILASVAVSGVSEMSLQYLTQIFTLSMIPFLMVRFFGFSLDDAKRFLRIFPYVTIISAISMLTIVGPSEILSYTGYRLGTEELNPIGIGSVFGLSIVITIASIDLKISNAIFGMISIAVSASILVLTGSRGPMLAVAITSMLLLLALRRLSPRMMIALGILFATAYWVLGNLSQIMVSDRFENAIDSTSAQDRFELWFTALDMFVAKPFTGFGLGSFEQAYGNYPHNIVLDHMVSGGILLVLSFSSIFWIILKGFSYGLVRHTSNLITILFLLCIYAVSVRFFSLSMANTKEIFLFLSMAISCSQSFHENQRSRDTTVSAASFLPNKRAKGAN